jgi:PPK2 family polyphosphate:nucleotide phosphotransferase
LSPACGVDPQKPQIPSLGVPSHTIYAPNVCGRYDNLKPFCNGALPARQPLSAKHRVRSMLDEEVIEQFRVPPGKKFKLSKYDPSWAGTDDLRELSRGELKDRARAFLDRTRADLGNAQEVLYADNRYALLIILQAMDTAGKDGTIKHVMSGVNPQGCQVFSFKKPSAEELDHAFLWRYMRCVPERGRIGIFNRSYYEDVLIVRVHPELLGRPLDGDHIGEKFWQARYKDINALERYLVRNGTLILKFFLHLSKGEQKKRLLERIDRPEKNWKFAPEDLAERGHWDQYMEAYEDALGATSTHWAPWYVVPADHKWLTRAVVADIVTRALRTLDLKYPSLSDLARGAMAHARRQLADEV